MTPSPPFEFLDAVTSDLAFRARGPTLGELFAAAAEAFLAATVERPDAVKAHRLCSIELAADAPDLLLLRFLNELVYLRDVEDLVLHPREIRVRLGEGARLEAALAGEPLDPVRHGRAADVKAATAHGLSVSRTADGWEAVVTLDV